MAAPFDVHQTKECIKRLKQVGMVMDLEGYQVGSAFAVREMGWCNHNGTQCGSYHYYSSKLYESSN